MDQLVDGPMCSSQLIIPTTDYTYNIMIHNYFFHVRITSGNWPICLVWTKDQ